MRQAKHSLSAVIVRFDGLIDAADLVQRLEWGDYEVSMKQHRAAHTNFTVTSDDLIDATAPIQDLDRSGHEPRLRRFWMMSEQDSDAPLARRLDTSELVG